MGQRERFNQEIRRRVEREIGLVEKRNPRGFFQAAKELLGEGVRAYAGGVNKVVDWVMENVPDVENWISTSPLFRPGGEDMDDQSILQEFKSKGPTGEHTPQTFDQQGYRAPSRGGHQRTSAMDQRASIMDTEVEQEAPEQEAPEEEPSFGGGSLPKIDFKGGAILVGTKEVTDADQLNDADAMALARELASANMEIGEPNRARQIINQVLEVRRRHAVDHQRQTMSLLD